MTTNVDDSQLPEWLLTVTLTADANFPNSLGLHPPNPLNGKYKKNGKKIYISWNKFCMIIARWLYDNCQMALLEDLEVHNSYLITILAEEGPQPQIENCLLGKMEKEKNCINADPTHQP